jgi:hypothetical protein
MSSGEKNLYWIPNLDINKKVIIQEIQYYLGPESSVRPYTREVGPRIACLEIHLFTQNSRVKMGS